MIKISLADLSDALQLIKATSHDMMLVVRQESDILTISYQSSDGPLNSIQIFDESTHAVAKVTATESLKQVITRNKNVKT